MNINTTQISYFLDRALSLPISENLALRSEKEEETVLEKIIDFLPLSTHNQKAFFLAITLMVTSILLVVAASYFTLGVIAAASLNAAILEASPSVFIAAAVYSIVFLTLFHREYVIEPLLTCIEKEHRLSWLEDKIEIFAKKKFDLNKTKATLNIFPGFEKKELYLNETALLLAAYYLEEENYFNIGVKGHSAGIDLFDRKVQEDSTPRIHQVIEVSESASILKEQRQAFLMSRIYVAFFTYLAIHDEEKRPLSALCRPGTSLTDITHAVGAELVHPLARIPNLPAERLAKTLPFLIQEGSNKNLTPEFIANSTYLQLAATLFSPAEEI